jgi:ATP-citrate lyase alpha-subunit
MEENPQVKYMVLLGEVGGTEEYKVIEAVKSGKITKPVIAWCIGTIAEHFSTGVQFGHAGASANAEMETAVYKNKAMAEAGIHVPASFNDLPAKIAEVFQSLNIPAIEEPKLNIVPKNIKQKLHLYNF